MMNREGKGVVYPYIPNSAPGIREEMMAYVGVKDLLELYEEVPRELMFDGALDIPPPILDEYGMKKHIEGLLGRNATANEYISFLGAGCANHYIPAVVDEITTRGEFLTCYAADSWGDHGKYQTFVEYNSMLCELLGTEAVSAPQHDGGQALATSICMSNRINGRRRVLLPESMNPQNRRIVENYIDSVQEEQRIHPEYIRYDRSTGTLDMDDLEARLDGTVTAVVMEPVSFLGIMEPHADRIGALAQAAGAECIAYVDPISLGVLEAPTRYGASIVCGDLHSLGLHLSCGNGHAGFISTSSEEKYLLNYKDFLFSFCEPEVEGEYVFGHLLMERTHYAQRAKGNEFTGTGTNLWMISAAVYMALMGPRGFEEVGETIGYNSRYAAKRIAELPGVQLAFQGAFFQEFVVDFGGTGKSVAEINRALRGKGIFGGYDLSRDFPELGQSALFCVTEVVGKQEVDQLIAALQEILG